MMNTQCVYSCILYSMYCCIVRCSVYITQTQFSVSSTKYALRINTNNIIMSEYNILYITKSIVYTHRNDRYVE